MPIKLNDRVEVKHGPHVVRMGTVLGIRHDHAKNPVAYFIQLVGETSRKAWYDTDLVRPLDGEIRK